MARLDDVNEKMTELRAEKDAIQTELRSLVAEHDALVEAGAIPGEDDQVAHLPASLSAGSAESEEQVGETGYEPGYIPDPEEEEPLEPGLMARMFRKFGVRL